MQIQQVTPVETKNAMHDDPVWIMLDKSKKFDADVEMVITISMPAKSLYDVAKESFDDGGNKAVDYVIEKLDIKNIKAALREAIMRMYEPNKENEIEAPIIREPVSNEIIKSIEGLKVD